MLLVRRPRECHSTTAESAVGLPERGMSSLPLSLVRECLAASPPNIADGDGISMSSSTALVACEFKSIGVSRNIPDIQSCLYTILLVFRITYQYVYVVINIIHDA